MDGVGRHVISSHYSEGGAVKTYHLCTSGIFHFTFLYQLTKGNWNGGKQNMWLRRDTINWPFITFTSSDNLITFAFHIPKIKLSISASVQLHYEKWTLRPENWRQHDKRDRRDPEDLTCFITLWSVYVPELFHKSIWSLHRPRHCTLKHKICCLPGSIESNN